MKLQPGDRVGVLISADVDTKIVRTLGTGVLLPEEIPGPEAGGLSELCRELNRTNPTIRLDSGEKVWGAEIWFMSEAKYNDMMDAYRADHWTIQAEDVQTFRKTKG